MEEQGPPSQQCQIHSSGVHPFTPTPTFNHQLQTTAEEVLNKPINHLMQLEGPTILPQDWLILLAQHMAQGNYNPQPFQPQPITHHTTTLNMPPPPLQIPTHYTQQAHQYITHCYQNLPYLQQRYPHFLHQLSHTTISPQLQLQFLLTIHHSGYTPVTHPNHHLS